MKTHVVVFTYKRPELLRKLLHQLEQYPVSVDVFDDDPSTQNDCRPSRHHVADERHGKDGFWKWVTTAFQEVKSSAAARFVFLPDDFSLCEDFLDRCEERWATLPNEKVSLNLLVDHRDKKANWTGRKPRRYNDLVDETWWVDGCFYAERAFFEAMDWQIRCIAPRTGNAHGVPLSSGVWRQATLRLHKRGLRMFRSHQSLVFNHGAMSLMNPLGRRVYPPQTIRWVDA